MKYQQENHFESLFEKQNHYKKFRTIPCTVEVNKHVVRELSIFFKFAHDESQNKHFFTEVQTVQINFVIFRKIKWKK